MKNQNELNLLSKNIIKLLTRYNCNSYLGSSNQMVITKEKPSANTGGKKNILNSILFLVLGILLILFVMITGFYLLLIIPFGMFLFNYLKEKEKVDEIVNFGNHEINIFESHIKIVDYSKKQLTLSNEQIDEIEIFIDKNERPYIGGIYLKGNEIEDTMLIELVSDNKRYLEDDLKLIAKYINLKMFE